MNNKLFRRRKKIQKVDVIIKLMLQIRLDTRLNRIIQLHYEKKNPLLLSRDSHFGEPIVLRSHEPMFHSGVKSTLSDVRLYYWIIRGRSFVKSVLKNCYLCKLVLGKPVMPPPTPALPDYRLHCMFPFQTIGIDYASPLYARDVYSRSDKLFKCYFLLITCTATRAVHIKLTSDFSSNSLILALRRCFARRRTPSQIISDNFKTFNAVEIRDFIRFNRIQWEFILERTRGRGIL